MKKDRNAGAMPVYPGMIPNYGGMVMPGQMIPYAHIIRTKAVQWPIIVS